MTDIVEKAKRSEMMSGIRSGNTAPEKIIRSELHRLGYRFRLHDKRLPGTPDIVLPKYRAVIQVHGCFWHGHDCHLMKWPSTRPEFWRAKIEGNVIRDKKNLIECEKEGWRAMVIWECALKGKQRRNTEDVTNEIVSWLLSDSRTGEIRGE